ncbi:kinesin-like protein KIF13A isoform X4 [Chironomus tepperi]|uniref:kinesin-like protein KIF13A isoform X4 n=1 Tax=Chironomus tepperi TaxID=113505 RepID=UPI00391F7DD8
MPPNPADNCKIKVAVRVRPFNRRELELDTDNIVEMDQQQTILKNTQTLDKIERKQPKTFAFDHCFYSTDINANNFATQENVFDTIGRDILDNAFQGYNACIFAYGQTGSGKSYTMMGTLDQKGIIPRLCDSLFASIAEKQTDELSFKVEVSYMEIYNEKVHDLLDPKPNKQSLKVREHNVLGPYVDGLSQLAVASFEDIDNLMGEGNKSRTVAATNMNAESSRSHAVFTIVLTQTLKDTLSGVTGEKVAKMSLVDLAGSERAAKTGAVGDRLKEGSNINKSLTTLGLVISKLADQSSGVKNRDKFVPYRDSVLTWLLKDNLGGNSKTVMVATISPSADNYEETLSTLRYADRAKRIVNHAVINEDPNARIIRELRKEVEMLKEMLKHATGCSPVGDRMDIHDKITESENLMKQISQTWEDKLKTTERIQNERQQALEKMGISVQASGIQVEKNKYYLVNLNADPSLNELLVYYLKEHTLVGGRASGNNNEVQPDIQLYGLGILQEHCVISIEDGDLFMEPINNARCFVNGSCVTKKTTLHHGDRILWGNHHFFRVNCPKVSPSGINMSSEPQTPAQPLDYNFAREELMQHELSNDPIQAAISRLEKQHEEDKQVALEMQRKEYERQFQQLRNILSPTTPYAPYAPYDPLRFGKMTPCTPTSQMRVEKWVEERDEMFKRSLGQLKTDIMRANALVQEANFLAEEMGKQTKFSVTLQIPPANLSPNRRRGAFVSEPAILVRRLTGSQVWTMEKLENKLIDMRELYQEYKDRPMGMMPIEEHSMDTIHADNGDDDDEDESKNRSDPFYESQENHNLIGVANIFLEALFHDVKLDYHTPIISQQGEVAGRLQVEISRIAGQFPQDRMCESQSESSHGSRDDYDDDKDMDNHNQITCKIVIKQATGLPLSLSNFVFCQYTFWGHQEAVVPVIDQNCNLPAVNQNMTFKFEHEKDYTVSVTEEFLEHCAEGALSIEVWGHRSVGFSRSKGWEVEQQQAKARSLADRWAELSRKIELWVEIQELNDNGEYAPVEVVGSKDMLTGGVYQLRQGQQRRIQTRISAVPDSGTLPIICQSIINISIGSVTVRSRLQKPLDSYQEEDLTVLREKWSEALGRRRKYLDQQIQKLINKEDKTEQEKERELSLVNQWVSLTEERNAVLVPAAGSGIPGAPAAWEPSNGMEPHVPVLFLDLNADDLSTQNSNDDVSVSGINSILPKEHGNKFYSLQILQHLEKDICAICSWDSSIHDSQALNRVTEGNERVYLILKTTVRLSHPAPMDLVLRKRLAINIYKRQSITDKLKKLRIVGKSDTTYHSGVTYEVVSNIPKASEELEERESLAQIAATGEDCSLSDGETYIEKYTRGVSAVESILVLDRLRQSVAVKELETQQSKQQLSMRKTASVPNFSQIMRFDTSMENLIGIGRSESYVDLNNSDFAKTLLGSSNNLFAASTGNARGRHSFSGKSTTEDPLNANSKPSFGLGSITILSARPTFLSLNLNLNALRLQPGKPSPASSKLAHRMTTLHEETSLRNNPLPEENEDSYSDPEYDYDSKPSTTNANYYYAKSRMRSSHTIDSFMDIEKKTSTTSTNLLNYKLLTQNQPFHVQQQQGMKSQDKMSTTTATTMKNGKVESVIAAGSSPSMNSSTSSGYGSQAVSISNLTNEDTLSLQSMSVDENTPVDFQSSSPPKKDATTIYTPSSGQKRFNPFMKENTMGKQDDDECINEPTKIQHNSKTNTSPTHKKPLTPTKDHPLKDLVKMKPSKGEFMDDSDDYVDEQDDAVVVVENNNIYSINNSCENLKLHDNVGSIDVLISTSPNNEINNHISPENENTNQHVITQQSPNPTSNVDDEKNNNTRLEMNVDSDEEIDKQRLVPDRVVRRKKSPSRNTNNNNVNIKNNNRMSYPIGRDRSQPRIEDALTRSTDRIDDELNESTIQKHVDLPPPPEWVVVGESVLIRPYNTSGVIGFIGPTHFQGGIWVGVELDTPTGKNDGTVQGIQYFTCRPKHGIFVRADKLIQDKRGRGMRTMKQIEATKARPDGSLTRSKSRGEALNAVGTQRK